MRLVDRRGTRMPAIDLPGGTLLLGTGRGGVIYLMNENDVPYRHGDAALHLNPHFDFSPPGRVSVRRMEDGSPAGMCFHARLPGEDVRKAEREDLYAELAGQLSAAFEADPDLGGFVARACAMDDLRAAEEAFRTAAGALVEAGRAAVEARIRAGVMEGAETDPAGERPAAFLVVGLPGSDGGDEAAVAEASLPLVRSLRAGVGGRRMPFVASVIPG